MAFRSPLFHRIRLYQTQLTFWTGIRVLVASCSTKKKQKLRVYNGLQRGGFEVVSEERLRINTANLEVATVKYNTFVGNDGVGNKYYFNDDFYKLCTALTFVVGFTYRFDQSNFTNLFYPIQGGIQPISKLEFSVQENGTLGGAYILKVLYILDDAEVTREKYYR